MAKMVCPFLLPTAKTPDQAACLEERCMLFDRVNCSCGLVSMNAGFAGFAGMLGSGPPLAPDSGNLEATLEDLPLLERQERADLFFVDAERSCFAGDFNHALDEYLKTQVADTDYFVRAGVLRIPPRIPDTADPELGRTRRRAYFYVRGTSVPANAEAGARERHVQREPELSDLVPVELRPRGGCLGALPRPRPPFSILPVERSSVATSHGLPAFEFPCQALSCLYCDGLLAPAAGEVWTDQGNRVLDGACLRCGALAAGQVYFQSTSPALVQQAAQFNRSAWETFWDLLSSIFTAFDLSRR